MNARSEGDEAPLWLDAHACQEARSGGTDAPAGRAGIAAHYVDLQWPAGVAQKFRVSETSNAPEGRANVSTGHASTCTATASGSSAAVGHS